MKKIFLNTIYATTITLPIASIVACNPPKNAHEYTDNVINNSYKYFNILNTEENLEKYINNNSNKFAHKFIFSQDFKTFYHNYFLKKENIKKEIKLPYFSVGFTKDTNLDNVIFSYGRKYDNLFDGNAISKEHLYYYISETQWGIPIIYNSSDTSFNIYLTKALSSFGKFKFNLSLYHRFFKYSNERERNKEKSKITNFYTLFRINNINWRTAFYEIDNPPMPYYKLIPRIRIVEFIKNTPNKNTPKGRGDFNKKAVKDLISKEKDWREFENQLIKEYNFADLKATIKNEVIKWAKSNIKTFLTHKNVQTQVDNWFLENKSKLKNSDLTYGLYDLKYYFI